MGQSWRASSKLPAAQPPPGKNNLTNLNQVESSTINVVAVLHPLRSSSSSGASAGGRRQTSAKTQISSTYPGPPPKRQKFRDSTSRALSGWLAAPMVVPPDMAVAFADIPGLSPKLVSRLSFPLAFAVQSALIPLLLSGSGAGGCACICRNGVREGAPYALPIVQSFANCTITRLCAVVILPTRELVAQVAAVFSAIGGKVKIGVALGSKPLAVEQKMLVPSPAEGMVGGVRLTCWLLPPGGMSNTFALRSASRWSTYGGWWLTRRIDCSRRASWRGFRSFSISLGKGRVEIERVLSDLAVPPPHETPGAEGCPERNHDAGCRQTRRVKALPANPCPCLPRHCRHNHHRWRPRRNLCRLAGVERIRPAHPIGGGGAETPRPPRPPPRQGRPRHMCLSNPTSPPLSCQRCSKPFCRSVRGWTVGIVTGDMERKRREKVLSKFKTERVDMYPLPHPLFFILFPPPFFQSC